MPTQIKHQLWFNIWSSGDIATGSMFHRFSTDTAKDILASLIDDESAWEPFKEEHFHLCAIVCVLNWHNQQINSTLYKELCTSLYLKLVTKFKWAVIFPSLHRVLFHYWGVIKANEYGGICSGSEEGLEATNQLVMHLCIDGAHKTSTKANLTDTFQHFVLHCF